MYSEIAQLLKSAAEAIENDVAVKVIDKAARMIFFAILFKITLSFSSLPKSVFAFFACNTYNLFCKAYGYCIIDGMLCQAFGGKFLKSVKNFLRTF